MRKKILTLLLLSVSTLLITMLHAANIVPNEIKLPGSQPNEVSSFESPDKCDNCHASYNDLEPEHEPATGFTWNGTATSTDFSIQ